VKVKGMKTKLPNQLTDKMQSTGCFDKDRTEAKVSKIEKNMTIQREENYFECKNHADSLCLWRDRHNFKKNNSFFTPWVYLFLNLPVAFNKN
jgi:hypothetical protein